MGSTCPADRMPLPSYHLNRTALHETSKLRRQGCNLSAQASGTRREGLTSSKRESRCPCFWGIESQVEGVKTGGGSS